MPNFQESIVAQRYITLILIFLCSSLLLIVYWPSFSVPFYLDDRISIVENTLLTQHSMKVLFDYYGMRFITYLSFWLNVQWFEGNLHSFHLVNLLIHFINGVFVAILSAILLRKFTTLTSNQIILYSIMISGLWLLHPLNTQAVTYIVQRTASLVTLFALISVICYLKLRIEGKSYRWLIPFVLSIAAGLLTKQNYIAVILFLALFELLFLENYKQHLQKLVVISIFFIGMIYPFQPELFEMVSNITKETTAISRYDYFITQLIVIWTYLGKFFYPMNLQLDMGVELAKESTGWHFIAFLGHLLLLGAAITARKIIPIFSFGILWYYVGHSVESFVIPITDLAFEHRTYLPNIGLTISAFSLLMYSNLLKQKSVYFVFTIIVILLSYLTYERNTQWLTTFNFYQNELKNAPNSTRSKEAFAIELISIGEIEKAQKLLIETVNENMRNKKVTVSSLDNLMKVLFQQEKYQTGIQTAQLALRYIHNSKDRSNILTTISYGYIKMGYCDFAVGLADTALKLDSSNTKARENLDYCLFKLHKQN